MRTLYLSVQFFKKDVRYVYCHLSQLPAINDKQYDTSQYEVEYKGEPQGVVAHQGMQPEEQSKERSRGYCCGTKHRLRLGDAYEDAIEDERRHSCQRYQYRPAEVFARCRNHPIIARQQTEKVFSTYYI